MSGSQVLTFTVGAAAGVCVASALFWATKREKSPKAVATEPAPDASNGINGINGVNGVNGVAEKTPEKAPEAEEKNQVPAEDRPADAPESCPGVSSSSDRLDLKLVFDVHKELCVCWGTAMEHSYIEY